MDLKKTFIVIIITMFGSCLLLYRVMWSKSSSMTVLSSLETDVTASLNIQHGYVHDPERTENKLRTRLGFFVSMDNLPSPVKAESDKYIIYRCLGGLCGGLADREKGIVTSYVVSQMLRRKFGIMMDKKCDFSKYVQPNLVNWVVDANMTKGKSIGSLRKIDNFSFGKEMRDGNLESIYNKEVMFYNANTDYVDLIMNKRSFRSLPWTKNKTHHEVYQIAFGHLFKLAQNTEKKFTKIYEQTSDQDLLCAHLRIGKSKTIPRDAVRAFRPNFAAVFKFIQGKISNSSKVFVATDSDEVRVKMRNAFPSQYMEVAGPIVHIDRPGGTYNCSAMEKAILDQFILGRCDTLVISSSGFSRIAAILRGTDDNLYLVVGKNVTAINRLNPSLRNT